MLNKPAIFISSTGDLRSARDLVAKVLHSMGYEPVWQDVEPTDGGEMLGVLRRWIDPCRLMIQLVGGRYGAEPPGHLRSEKFGRVSYTQYEALYFESLGRKVIYYFLDAAFPADPAAPEPAELAELQGAYRARIEAANRLHQDRIAGARDLELSVRRISDELAQLRRQSDSRYRRLIFLAGAAAAGITVVALAVAGGAALLHHAQSRQTTRIEQQTAKLDRQAAEAGDQSRQLARIEKVLRDQRQADPGAPPTLSPADLALLERAKGEGDLRTRAAASVLRPDAGTDALLAELRARRDAEAFDLAMLQGKRLYFDKMPRYDEAVAPFEQAMGLRPDSIDARSYAARAHTFARLGDLAAHRERAIEICRGTLRLAPPRSAEWAAAQFDLGNAWQSVPAGDRGENIRNAVAAYEAALTVRTRDAAPAEWAAAQHNLGTAWGTLPAGDRGENLGKSVACYEAALTVYTRGAFPADWAMTQNNLGNAWDEMPTGDRGENLRRSVAAYEAALTIRTRDAHPADWASAQYNLAIAVADLAGQPGEDRCGRLRQAIACDKGALTVYTAQAFPREHADATHNLGLDQKSYEAAGCAGRVPSEDIRPAE